MTDYFLVVHHPNGGYTAVACEEGVVAPPPKKNAKRFQTPDDAYMWASNHSSKYGTKYSPEVSAEIRSTFANATRRDR